MMKLKLEPNLFTTKYSKKGEFSDIFGKADVIMTIIQRLLAPLLQLRSSMQVPIKVVNSKGFLKAKRSNRSMIMLDLVKSFDHSGNEKALFISVYNLFSQEGHSSLSAFSYLFSRGSSLRSSILINPN